MFWIKFFVAATKPNTKRNKTSFISYYPLLNILVKNKTSFESIFYVRFDAVNKKIKQNKRENIVQCWFYETSIKILRQISNAPPSLLLSCLKIPTLVQ